MSSKMISLAHGVTVDVSRKTLVIETPGKGTYGIFRAPQVGTDGEAVWMETNGDPVMVPHPSYDDEMALFLSDAGITREQLYAALDGVEWFS